MLKKNKLQLTDPCDICILYRVSTYMHTVKITLLLLFLSVSLILILSESSPFTYVFLLLLQRLFSADSPVSSLISSLFHHMLVFYS